MRHLAPIPIPIPIPVSIPSPFRLPVGVGVSVSSAPPTTPTLPAPTSAPTSAPISAPPARLAWVNPARCLPSCAQAPANLVRIDAGGELDPQGRFQVEAPVQEPLRALLAAGRAAGHALRIASAFRSYADQTRVFRTTREAGRAARPGHSEHQLGTAVDLRLPTGAAIAWLAAQAPAHGFALSYPPGKQKLTGYRPEPWHIRFIGPTLATEVVRNGWALEELFRARPELGESGSCQDCPATVSRKPCGPVTAVGRCRGDVLTWCYEGALASVDCRTSRQSCGLTADGQPDCLPAAPDGEAPAATAETAEADAASR